MIFSVLPKWEFIHPSIDCKNGIHNIVRVKFVVSMCVLYSITSFRVYCIQYTVVYTKKVYIFSTHKVYIKKHHPKKILFYVVVDPSVRLILFFSVRHVSGVFSMLLTISCIIYRAVVYTAREFDLQANGWNPFDTGIYVWVSML